MADRSSSVGGDTSAMVIFTPLTIASEPTGIDVGGAGEVIQAGTMSISTIAVRRNCLCILPPLGIRLHVLVN